MFVRVEGLGLRVEGFLRCLWLPLAAFGKALSSCKGLGLRVWDLGFMRIYGLGFVIMI